LPEELQKERELLGSAKERLAMIAPVQDVEIPSSTTTRAILGMRLVYRPTHVRARKDACPLLSQWNTSGVTGNSTSCPICAPATYGNSPAGPPTPCAAFVVNVLGLFAPFGTKQSFAKSLNLKSPCTPLSMGKGNAMPEDKLVLYFVPVLLNREKAKGQPLTEHEVLEIRDSAAVIALRPETAAHAEQERGYKDIDAENVWEEWQKARIDPP
jgi:hypothetical protein